jgi:hypothetical protein
MPSGYVSIRHVGAMKPRRLLSRLLNVAIPTVYTSVDAHPDPAARC